MIKIKFDDLTLHVPDSWQDITLSQYEKWHAHKPATKLEYVRYVADVCGIEADVLLDAPSQLFDVVADTISFVFDNEFEPSNKIEIDSTDYYISFADKLTLGEWVDVDDTIAGDSTTKMADMLAILCRPIGEKYDPDTAEERKKLFRNITCDKALPLINFFLFKKKQSDAILNHYSTVMAQAGQFLKDTKTFVQSGDGIRRLPIWQRIRYTYLTRLLEKELSKCSDFSSTAPTRHAPKKNSTSSKSR